MRGLLRKKYSGKLIGSILSFLIIMVILSIFFIIIEVLEKSEKITGSSNQILKDSKEDINFFAKVYSSLPWLTPILIVIGAVAGIIYSNNSNKRP